MRYSIPFLALVLALSITMPGSANSAEKTVPSPLRVQAVDDPIGNLIDKIAKAENNLPPDQVEGIDRFLADVRAALRGDITKEMVQERLSHLRNLFDKDKLLNPLWASRVKEASHLAALLRAKGSLLVARSLKDKRFVGGLRRTAARSVEDILRAQNAAPEDIGTTQEELDELKSKLIPRELPPPPLLKTQGPCTLIGSVRCV